MNFYKYNNRNYCQNNTKFSPCNSIKCPPGPKGDTGSQGPAGTADTITVRYTITGDPGTDAQVVDVTGSPNHVLDFIILKGDKGDEGEVGPQGPKGDTGEQGPAGQCECCICFNQLKNVLDQLIELYPTTTAVINFSSGTNIAGRLSSLYPNYGNAGLINIKNSSGNLIGAGSLCNIASISLSGVNYIDEIIYLDEPIVIPDNCYSYCEKSFRQALPVGTLKVNLKTGNQSIGSGTVLKNKWGMLVLVNSAGKNPTFVVTCQIDTINKLED